jgi:hypothetical protein
MNKGELHIMRLHNWYFLPSFISDKVNEEEMCGTGAHKGEIKNAYTSYS